MKNIETIKKTDHLEIVKKGKDILVLLTEKQDIIGRIVYVERNNKYTFHVATGLYQITDAISKEIDEVLTEYNNKK